ncbi:TetR/AcrR family transcriptional regulator [Paraburkholderia sp. D15]|uniref:TetR/AcrR family transcriptional regulator n=1 Tax=Paraburkholderia sp. D15 TaxID=2880218 RepID=UPI00247A0C8E|nr:TetR/AcrR family transcriptional regulator [Paraburkholderia sp. D15]WGS52093.1 TetR/AcrR family transcriptional regulator [Paraburkholderia sp. D15]WKF59626.1 Biofilm operon icaADBC HTH-type negative transcriptional regulator IcaR [Paraburkholderia busanensis]
MPKPTKTEITADIIDRAAALFARHGFEHTSLQQIADAVNYSKAGLLHHFPSKLAIYAAALETVREHMQSLRANVESLPVGIKRDRAVVEDMVQFTYDWPGISALSNRIADSEPDGDPQLVEVGLILYAALGIDLTAMTEERVVRVTSAFCGLGMTAMQAVRVDRKREWRDHIVHAAMNALGHRSR